MKNRHMSTNATGAVVILCAMALSGHPATAGSLVTIQPGNYQQGGCTPPNSDVPDWSYPIRNGFSSLGWGSTFWTGPDAWPQDFVDPGDSVDQFDVAVFLGHGNSGRLYFSVPHNNMCSTHADSMQIAAGTGARVSSAVIMACCFAEIGTHMGLMIGHQFEKQLMGFGSPAALDSGMVNNYWNGTGGSSNVDSWLNNMEDRPGWFTGDNTTVVMSRGHDDYERWWNQTYCGLKRQNCVTGGEGGGYWAFNWHWNGCGSCDNCMD